MDFTKGKPLTEKHVAFDLGVSFDAFLYTASKFIDGCKNPWLERNVLFL